MVTRWKLLRYMRGMGEQRCEGEDVQCRKRTADLGLFNLYLVQHHHILT